MVDLKYIGYEPKEFFRDAKVKIPVKKSDDNIQSSEKMGLRPNVFLVEHGDVLTDVRPDIAEALKNIGPTCLWVEVESVKKKRSEDVKED